MTELTELRLKNFQEATRPGWGSIMVAVRMEKMVEAKFVTSAFSWITNGLRPGDRWETSEGLTAHNGANLLVRKFLKSNCDTILFIDSDAELELNLISKMRDHEPGFEFDALQAFYLVRQWPPEAIWFQRDSSGTLRKCVVFGEATEEVAIVGLHCVMIRRNVFETLLGNNNSNTHDWFFYPRHEQTTEDAAFSFEAIEAGFRLGATSIVTANHIAHLSIGWQTYQEYLRSSGMVENIERYSELMKLMIDFTGESEQTISALCAKGSKNLEEAWSKINPLTKEEVDSFYGDYKNGYLYDLMNWNTSSTYNSIISGLNSYSGKHVLVIGSGLGTEVDMLEKNNNKVFYYDLPGVLLDFCEQRIGKRAANLANVYDKNSVYKELSGFGWNSVFNVVVCIDVLEHIHPTEIRDVLVSINNVLPEGGQLYCHNNYGQQDIYPMHFDHSSIFKEWTIMNNFSQTSPFVWTKGETK